MCLCTNMSSDLVAFTNFAELSSVASRAGALKGGPFGTLPARASILTRVWPAGSSCWPGDKSLH